MAWDFSVNQTANSSTDEAIVTSPIARVLIGIPHRDNLSGTWVMGLLSALQDQRFKFDVVMDGGSRPIDLSRNIMVSQALKWSQNQYLFFLDSDIILSDDHIHKLFKVNRDIVGGVYRARAPPSKPVAIVNGQHLEEEVLGQPFTQTVDELGMGCCLIKTDVFRTIGKFLPWRCLTNHKRELGGDYTYYVEYQEAKKVEFACPYCKGLLVAPFFRSNHGFEDDDPGSEDYTFCHLARKYDFEIFARCDVVPSHETRVLIGKDGITSMMKGSDAPL